MRHQTVVGVLCLLVAAAAPALAQVPGAVDLPHVAANDNQVPAGELRDGVLSVHLELREARWCPESEEGMHLSVYTFAEAGTPPRNPGPFIRVPRGTTIRASVHNLLPVAATVHGLHRHPGDDADVLALGAGETRAVEFEAGEPGTYLYWATTSNRKIADRNDKETTLSGALVVDAPGAARVDRTFVVGVWTRGEGREFQEIPIINGKSWPFSEHLTYTAGETARWRVLDASFSDHAMHLHGFYFLVDGAGDGERFERYDEDRRRRVVTEHVLPGHVFDMSWTPERSGNWIFHCHMVAHMSPPEILHPSPSGAPAAAAPGHAHDPSAGMGGMVVGVTVLPGAHAPTPASTGEARKLQLAIADNPAKVPLFSLVLHDPAAPAPADAAPPKPALMGPPIVLTRGQPVEIEVRNATKGPTAIHWHGIELESYYDGVPGWTGSGRQTTPPIAAGETFVARMTPPRAGTFIYHTHWHDDTQLLNGMYGPLIVLEPGETYDPDRDKTFLVSRGNYAPFGPLLLLNGTPEPFPLFLKTGTTYRFRFINITDNLVDLRWRMTADDAPVEWKVVAKDGAALPAAQVKTSKADLGITVGETWDVEYQAERPGRVDLQTWLPEFPVRLTQPLVFAPPK